MKLHRQTIFSLTGLRFKLNLWDCKLNRISSDKGETIYDVKKFNSTRTQTILGQVTTLHLETFSIKCSAIWQTFHLALICHKDTGTIVRTEILGI